MKVLFEKGEIDRIQSAYQILIAEGMSPLFSNSDPDQVFSLQFKVTDPALAHANLGSMLYTVREGKELESALGIEVVSINGNEYVDLRDLRQKIHDQIDSIFRERGN